MPGEQFVLFEEGKESEALERGAPATMLTAFFIKNAEDESARKYILNLLNNTALARDSGQKKEQKTLGK